jgi:hypothetical protein
MENLNNHSLEQKTYSEISTANAGHRLHIISFRNRGNKEEGRKEPICFELPIIMLKKEELSDKHIEAFCMLVMNEQDNMLRECLKNSGRVSASILKIENILEYVTNTYSFNEKGAKTGRVGGKAIGEWFTECIADNIAEALLKAGKSTEAVEKTLVALLNDYVSLASNKTKLSELLRNDLLRFIKKYADDNIVHSSTRNYLISKLSNVAIARQEIDLSVI